jgi:two-component system, sensor histidine kinase and response regulator
MSPGEPNMPGPLSEPTPIGGTSRRHHAWAAAAGALVVLGTIGSAFGANAVARNSNQVALQALQSSSAEIASTLQLAVQREDDLTISAGGFIASNPNVSNRQFSQWVSSLHTVARYPELRGLGYIAKVTAAALPAYAAQAVRDPTGPLAAGGTFQISPAGNRPFYCLEAAAVATGGEHNLPAGIDFCTIKSVHQWLLTAQDSGRSAYALYRIGKTTLLTTESPVYRDGMALGTVAERRAAILGWIGTALVPDVVLDQALRGHPNTALSFSYRSGSSSGMFREGTVPLGARGDGSPPRRRRE